MRTTFGETLLIVAAGIATRLMIGALIGATLLRILAGVFDPPADAPAVPVVGIAATIVFVGLALAIAFGIADRGIARLSVVSALRER